MEERRGGERRSGDNDGDGGDDDGDGDFVGDSSVMKLLRVKWQEQGRVKWKQGREKNKKRQRNHFKLI